MLQITFSTFSTTVMTLVGELLNCNGHFCSISGFPDLLGKVFWSILKFPNFSFQWFFARIIKISFTRAHNCIRCCNCYNTYEAALFNK